MIDPETPKVVAKAGEELAKLGQEAIKFLNRIAGGPLEELGGLVQDQFAFMRVKRRLNMARILDESRRQLEAACVEPEPVPIRVLEPILSQGSLEDDESMGHLWAGLLASAGECGDT